MPTHDDIEERLAARILACPSLPTMPAVAVRVLDLCEVDEVDLAAIGDAVSQDPAISAKLLRMANSASFATRGKVASLTRAVALLGTNATLGVALSFSLVGGRRRSDAGGFDHAAFWRRAVFSAIAGRSLGHLGETEEDDAFVACLLQDIGMLALNEVFPGDYGQLCLAAGGDHEAALELEGAALGVDHVQVGGLLARRWNLPERLREAIASSHRAPAQQRTGDALALHQVAYLSGRLADVWTSARPVEASRAALAAAAHRLGLGAQVVPAALQRMAASVPEASADFELDLGGPDRVQAVLAEARRLLGALQPGGGSPEPEPAVLLQAELFHRLLEDEVERARRGGRPLALLVAGAPPDGGRQEAELARLFKGSLRQTDVLARQGGLFLALLTDTPVRGALVAAERIRARLGASGRASAVGLACLAAGVPASADTLLDEARAALVAETAGAPP